MPSKYLDSTRVAQARPAIATISMFGQMRACDARGRSILPNGRKARALLALLVLSANRPILRSQITGLLWSRRDKEQGRASLRQALRELQQALVSIPECRLEAERNHVMLRDHGLWIDAVQFTFASPVQPEPLEIFQPSFLDDLRGLDDAFDAWSQQQADVLTRVARSIGERILAAQCDPDAVIRAAQRLLHIDGAHEGAWRAIIEASTARGDRGAALAAYESCTVALLRAGQADPSPATQALLADIRHTPARTLSASSPRWTVSARDRAQRIGVAAIRCADPNDLTGAILTVHITAALLQHPHLSCHPVTWPPSADRQTHGPVGYGVDFQLEGYLQRHGDHLRLIARLTDMQAGGEVIWARRFDRQGREALAVQDDLTTEAVAEIAAAIAQRAGERQRRSFGRDPDSLGLVLRAMPYIYQLEQVNFGAAGHMLEAAVVLDPRNADAHVWLAHWHLLQVGQGWAPDPVAATARAAALAEQAVALDPDDARALTLAGHIRGFLHKRAVEAQSLHDRAIKINPNSALAWCFLGLSHSYMGDHLHAIQSIEQARRAAPHDPHAFFFDTAQVMPHLLRREFEQAAQFGRSAIARNPGFSSALKGQLSVLGHLGLAEEIVDVRARLLTLEPNFCVRDAIVRSPVTRTEDVATYAEGLRLAGLPD